MEQLAWNPTSDKIAYTCRKKTGLEYAVSTNSDIYVYDLKTKQTTNITEENKGYDTNPQYSPDGKYMVFQLPAVHPREFAFLISPPVLAIFPAGRYSVCIQSEILPAVLSVAQPLPSHSSA